MTSSPTTTPRPTSPSSTRTTDPHPATTTPSRVPTPVSIPGTALGTTCPTPRSSSAYRPDYLTRTLEFRVRGGPSPGRPCMCLRTATTCPWRASRAVAGRPAHLGPAFPALRPPRTRSSATASLGTPTSRSTGGGRQGVSRARPPHATVVEDDMLFSPDWCRISSDGDVRSATRARCGPVGTTTVSRRTPRTHSRCVARGISRDWVDDASRAVGRARPAWPKEHWITGCD